MQGKYNSTNTKNETPLAKLKFIADEPAINVAPRDAKFDDLLDIAMLDKINSFATNPTPKAQIMFGLFSPIGLNIQLIILLT